MHHKCFPNLGQSFVSLLQILVLVYKFQEPIAQTLGIMGLIALVDLWSWPINCKIYLTVYREKSPTRFTGTETPLRLRHVTLILTVIYLRSNVLESNQVAVQILTDHTAPVRWCNIRTRASLAEFKGHKGQAAKHAGASEELREEVNGGEKQRQREGCERTTITQAACGFQLLAKTSHSLRPRRFSLSYPIPLSSPLAALPTPTLDRTQMVWIRGLHDWAVATDEILKSDSLLSLNTPD